VWAAMCRYGTVHVDKPGATTAGSDMTQVVTTELGGTYSFSPRSSCAVAIEGLSPTAKAGAVVTSSRASKRRCLLLLMLND